jgi:hypothetical protein
MRRLQTSRIPDSDKLEQATASPASCAVVRQLLEHMYPQEVWAEKRKTQRVPYPFLLQITPVDEEGTPLDEPMTVVGKDLSEQGIGFFHREPLPHRLVKASVEDMTGQTIAVLIDLTWCCFTKQGWYESGGRFLHVAVDRPNQEFLMPASG